MWIEQVDKIAGHLFQDTYLHSGCYFIRSWKDKDEMLKKDKRHLEQSYRRK